MNKETSAFKDGYSFYLAEKSESFSMIYLAVRGEPEIRKSYSKFSEETILEVISYFKDFKRGMEERIKKESKEFWHKKLSPQIRELLNL